MLVVFLFSCFELAVMMSSSSADTVAIAHMMIAVIVNPATQYNSGKQNNAIPVALLAYVWMKDNALYFRYPSPSERKRINAIMPIQPSIHDVHGSRGMNTYSMTAKKIKSAMLSKTSPSLLQVFTFLAR